MREAKAAAAFSHPHAVSIYDAGDEGGVLYLVMQLIDGESLAQVLAQRGPLGLAESIAIADQVLQALGAAHRAGVVHRDVKPGNVLIARDGTAMLADFGIAKRLHDVSGDVTMVGELVGTPTYLAPEQAEGAPATPATDLYSTGVLLFEMLTKEPPFAGATPMATALAHRDAPVPDVRDRRAMVPAHVAAAIRRAMAKDPAARFATADDMRHALAGPAATAPSAAVAPAAAAHAATSIPPRAVPVTEVMAARPTRLPRHWWWWLALAGAAAVTLAVVLLDRNDDPALTATAGATTVAPVAPVATLAPATPAPTPSSTTPPTTPAPIATTVAPPPPTTAPANIAELVVLIAADPERFGRFAESMQRDLERIAAGDDRRAERLRRLLDERVEQGTITPEAAALVDALLPPPSDGDADRGDDDDD